MALKQIGAFSLNCSQRSHNQAVSVCKTGAMVPVKAGSCVTAPLAILPATG